jgi:urease accessory protein
LRLERDDKPLWLERAALAGSGVALSSPAVLAGHCVVGTLIAVSPGLSADLLDACRQAAPLAGAGAVTLLPHALVGRYLGESSEAAKTYFIELWRVLRPALLGRNAVEPRIWRT